MPRTAPPPYTGLRDQAQTIIQAALADLPARNGHHEFEQLAYRIVQARIAPNVMLPTGPVSAGGDAGRDAETYWVVADDFDRSTFALSPAEGLVVGVTTTAKKRLSAKIGKDVARCCQDGGVRRIIYFVSESLPDGERRAIVNKVLRTHGIEIDIYDRLKVAVELCSDDLFAIAVSWLHLPESLLPMALPLDRLHALSRVEAKIARGRLGHRSDEFEPFFPSPLTAVLTEVTDDEGWAEAVDQLTDWLAEIEMRCSVALGTNRPSREEDLAHTAAALPAFTECAIAWRTARDGLRPAARTITDGWRRDIEWAQVATWTVATVRAALTTLREAIEADYTSRSDEFSAGAARVYLQIGKALAVAEALSRHARCEHSGVLVIEGEWGTGKSFHLAQFALDRIDAGQPTIFVAGSALGQAHRPNIIEATAQHLSASRSGSELLAALRLHAEVTQSRSVLVIDALNEFDRQLVDACIESVAAAVADTPEVSVVVSTRRDDAAEVHHDDDGPGVYRHIGVDPAAGWALLRRYFDLPPILVPWPAGDYSKPLMLRMLARVHRNNPGATVTPLAVPELMSRWLDVLGEEFATTSQKAVHDQGELKRLLKEFSSLGDRGTRDQLKEATRTSYTPERVDAAVNFLLDEGVFREQAGELAWAMQRVGEFYRARVALQAASWSPRQTLARAPNAGTRSLMIEMAPYEIGRELLPRRRARTADTVAFLQSIQHRDPAAVLPATRRILRRLVRRPHFAEFIWFAAVLNSVTARHPLGAVLVHTSLSQMSARGRRRSWLRPLFQMLNARNGDDRASLAEALLWIEQRAAAGQLDDQHANELALMVLWWCLLPNQRASSAAARCLTSLLQHYPQCARGVLVAARRSGDVDVHVGALAALLAALQRSNGSQPDLVAVANQEVKARRLPLHYHLLCLVYDIRVFLDHAQESPPPFAEFIRTHAARPPRRPPVVGQVLRHADGIDDVTQFAEWFVPPAHASWRLRDPEALAGSLLWPHVLRVGPAAVFGRKSSWELPVQVMKARNQAHQSFLAEMYAGCRIAEHIQYRNFQHVKPLPGSGLEPIRHNGPGDYPVDASPTIVAGFLSDSVPARPPWFVPPIVRRLATDRRAQIESAADLRCVGMDGRVWLPVDGTYRLALPAPEVTLPFKQVLQAWNGDLDPEPLDLPPGRRLHLYIRLRSVLLPARPSMPLDVRGLDLMPVEEEEISDAEKLSFGAAMRSVAALAVGPFRPTVIEYKSERRHWDAFIHARLPSPTLRSALGAAWTGRGVDCADAADVVICDPGLNDGMGPQTVLIRQDAVAALARGDHTIAWLLEVTNMSDRWAREPQSAWWEGEVTADWS